LIRAGFLFIRESLQFDISTKNKFGVEIMWNLVSNFAGSKCFEKYRCRKGITGIQDTLFL